MTKGRGGRIVQGMEILREGVIVKSKTFKIMIKSGGTLELRFKMLTSSKAILYNKAYTVCLNIDLMLYSNWGSTILYDVANLAKPQTNPQ